MTRKEMTTEDLQNKKKKWRKEQIFACVMASIPLLGFAIFNGFPLIISFIGMFCNVDLYDLTNIQWNNFEGFKSVFIPRHAYELFYFDLAKYFYKAVVITVWIASTQLVTLMIALFIATLLHEKPKGAKLFQILFFIPYICSTVAVSLMWRHFEHAPWHYYRLAERSGYNYMVHNSCCDLAGSRVRHCYV